MVERCQAASTRNGVGNIVDDISGSVRDQEPSTKCVHYMDEGKRLFGRFAQLWGKSPNLLINPWIHKNRVQMYTNGGEMCSSAPRVTKTVHSVAHYDSGGVNELLGLCEEQRRSRSCSEGCVRRLNSLPYGEIDLLLLILLFAAYFQRRKEVGG